MSDIVKRLRGLYDEWNSPHSSPDGLPTGASVMLEAAAEITRLTAEVERLRAALVDHACECDDGECRSSDSCGAFPCGRKARAALTATTEKGAA